MGRCVDRCLWDRVWGVAGVGVWKFMCERSGCMERRGVCAWLRVCGVMRGAVCCEREVERSGACGGCE